MRILANENFPKASVLALRSYGYDVVSIGKDNPRIQDEGVIAITIEQHRTIVNFDRSYGELVFRKGLTPPARIIYLRFSSFMPAEPAAIIHELITLQKFEFTQALTVVDNNFVRQRIY